jgi:hypothetical protein
MTSVDLRKSILSAFRRLLRVQHSTFSGDQATLLGNAFNMGDDDDLKCEAAKNLTRSQFRESAQTEEALGQKLAEAEEVMTFLRRNLVQAVKVNEAGQGNLFRTHP